VVFDANVDVTEWLGHEQLAYVPYDAPGDIEAALRRLARELAGESLRTQLVASLDARSAIRGGATTKLWLDARRMQLFDPDTGENLTRDATAGA
jgi:multiple sugar transport system ATP-binding protein